MIDRYVRPPMGDLLSPQARIERFTAVERAAARALHSAGLVDSEHLAEIEAAPAPALERVREIEEVTRHDIEAFVRAFAENVGGRAGDLVHLGLTSSDIVDTADAVLLRQAGDLIDAVHTGLLLDLRGRVLSEWWQLPCVGRTHGRVAEPSTFGFRMASHLLALHRSRARLRSAFQDASVGTLSGPVGTYPLLTPEMEAEALEELGLQAEPVPTQIVARDRHAALHAAMALSGTCIERLALEIRNLHRDEVAEAFEGLRSGQVGSSAMPHKRNPIGAERLCGLARVLRSNAQASFENVALWHERDLTHSSVERLITPTSLALTHYQLELARDVIRELEVDDAAMRRRFHTQYDQMMSGRRMTAAILAGATRQQARTEQADMAPSAEDQHVAVAADALETVRRRIEELDI